MEDKMTLFALGMLNSFFFQIRILIAKIWIKFELRLFVENLKQFAFDVCTVGRDEGHSMHATRLSTVQSARMSNHVVFYCRRLMSALCLGHQDLSLW